MILHASTNPTPTTKLIFMPHANPNFCHKSANVGVPQDRQPPLTQNPEIPPTVLKKKLGMGGIVKTPKTTNFPGGRSGGEELI